MGSRLRMLAAILVTAVLAPMLVLAATGERTYEIDRQAFIWGNERSTTSSKDWRRLTFEGNAHGGDAVLGAQPLMVGSTSPMSATLSVDVTGAPVEFRVVDNGVWRPGKAEFDGRHGDSSRTFTFVHGPTSSKCRWVHVEWRSPTGQRVVLDRAALVLTYKQASADDTGGCG